MKKKLYGSVFSKEQLKEVEDFVASIDIDKKLIKYDIEGSIIHAQMLGKQKIIEHGEAQILVKGLKRLLVKEKKKKLRPPEEEDVHTYVTNLLREELPEKEKKIADKLHTARSRNDQVSLDTRMYCLDKLTGIITSIASLQKSIYERASAHKEVIMPVYTHLQPAQAILTPHLLCAYLEELEKDKIRFKNARENADSMSLGSCAVRGTALNIDRRLVAQKLGFTKISQNSIEAISSRDFVLEILSCVVILSTNLSRIAEDLILYSTYEFDFIKIDESYLTGSSMMPNKRNADTLELIRGFSARALGGFVEVSSMMKNLPHAYNRDMQYDKEALFASAEGVLKCLNILKGIFKTLKVNRKRLKDYVKENDFIFATDIAEFLVKKGYSYRKSHDVTGEIIKYCSKHKKKIKDLDDKKLRQFSKFLSKRTIKDLVDPQKSVRRVKSEGGTSPESIAKQLNYWKKVLKINARI